MELRDLCHIRMGKVTKSGQTTQGHRIQHLLAALYTCFSRWRSDVFLKDVKAAVITDLYVQQSGVIWISTGHIYTCQFRMVFITHSPRLTIWHRQIHRNYD